MSNDHFEGKDALTHVTEKQAEGIVASAEIHGTEIPGHISAGADSARETAIILSMLWLILFRLDIPFIQIIALTGIFSVGWLFWKTGRSAWLGWSRLERLHRILEQERWEIEHHRQQEREELSVLYQAKGFEGKLLEDVLDVLMADSERILHVMLQEELGLTLEAHEHPLKQSLGACVGTLIACTVCLIGLLLHETFGIAIAGILILISAAITSAKFERNRPIDAVVWNLGLGVLSFGSVYFLLNFFEAMKNNG